MGGLVRFKISLKGAVQGVGFRPFVYRLAMELGLKGFVINDSRGVLIEVEGEQKSVERFLIELHTKKPPLAHLFSQEVEELTPCGYDSFEIRESEEEGQKEVFILPDIATCDECLRELFDTSDRRYLYPFINCTNCGPRFTIIESLPYDRPNTTMRVFPMCPDCEREYRDPLNRRFHAQPNACPVCGPQLSLYTPDGALMSEGDDALNTALELLRKGSILAIKGIGGFHLVCDATNEEAVNRLRERKRRQEKPFAVMFRDLSQLEEYARPSELEKAILLSPERPIVLVEKNKELASSVAPGLKKVGAFLPYSPLHHILLRGLSFPVVATSGNMSDEPIVKDNEDALENLSQFSDALLLHNRDIRRRCDDSVVKVIAGVPTPLRRSRGYAPLPVELPVELKAKVLAVGGMLKNTFALGMGSSAILSQHIGDIDSLTTLSAFEEAVYDLMTLYDFEPELVVCDMHPRYETTRWAKEFCKERGLSLLRVQHHHAHILSCMAENKLEGEVLGIAWDGTGYGEDGTLWGGEFLLMGEEGYERVFYFAPFKLIGGELAVKEPRRVALSLLLHIFGKDAPRVIEGTSIGFTDRELHNLMLAWDRNINAPLSSSVGRLFDAVASILNVRHRLSYEGQSAMMLEDMYDPNVRGSYSFDIEGNTIDWRPVILGVLEDRDPVVSVSRFINTLAEISLDVAMRLRIEKVCLSGGVMQNNPLVSRMKELLEGKGLKVFTHRKVPPNDGGLSLGQLMFASGIY